MTLNKGVYIFLILTWFACKNDKQLPQDIIEIDRMVNIVAEMEYAQAIYKLQFSSNDSIDLTILFDEIYEKYNISEQEFNESLSHYSKEPRIIQDIYEQVMENLSKQQAELFERTDN